MKYTKTVLAFVLLPIWLSQGCASKDQIAATKATEASSSNAQPDALSASLIEVNVDEAASLRIEEVREAASSKLLTTTGKIGFNEDRITHVVSPTTGYILELKARVGDPVKEGQTLAVIKSKDLSEAVADYSASQKDLDMAQKSYAMTKDLFEHEAASRMAFQQAENDLAKGRMQVERNAERLRLMGVSETALAESDRKAIPPRVEIKSPINGVVTERQATPAQYVAADGVPLFTIADLSTVWVLADVFERDLRLLSPNQRAQVMTPAFPDHVFAARVSRIDNSLDPTSRTVKVRSVVTNEYGRLRPEMFATVNFLLEDSAPALTIPAQAVLTESGSTFVYLAKGDRAFVRQKVDVQPGAPGRLRLIAGLRAGDKIVTGGTMLVRGEEDKKERSHND
jgi:cobalt-zinc-cadmium efflux system membrane fusion protein